jgi:hypothetical protein
MDLVHPSLQRLSCERAKLHQRDCIVHLTPCSVVTRSSGCAVAASVKLVVLKRAVALPDLSGLASKLHVRMLHDPAIRGVGAHLRGASAWWQAL